MVGMVGRLSPTKGQLVLVRAARRVVDARPGTRFRLLGAAAFGAEDYERRLRAEIDRLGLTDVVDLAGFVADPRRELDGLTVCVHASPLPEPFGQVVTEAMAWGVPVVATRGGGVDEIVRTHPTGAETGLVVPPSDEEALAAAIVEVIDHPAAALERAARAHEDVRRRFDADRGAEVVSRVWLEAAGRHRSGSEAAADRPRVAIAHDYLTQRGGAERVVLALTAPSPTRPIHTTLYDPDGTYPEFRDAAIVTSPINRIGPLRREHRAGAAPAARTAVSRLRVDADVVVASQLRLGARGARRPGASSSTATPRPAGSTRPTPTSAGPRHESLRGISLRLISRWLRRWDRRAAASARPLPRELHGGPRAHRGGIRHRRGGRCPRPTGSTRPAPASRSAALADWADDGYLLVVSRLLPYKNVDVAIEAVRGLPGAPRRRRRTARGGRAAAGRGARPTSASLSGLDRRRAALDVRRTPARSSRRASRTSGSPRSRPRPSACRPWPCTRGGYLDTIDEGVNGLFFEEATAPAIRAAIVAARDRPWDAAAIRAPRRAFSEARFHERIRAAVAEVVALEP